MLRVLAVLYLCLATATACLWDRDTLADEAKGRPETMKIIVGWFDRHPPRYYEMRLERVTGEIAGNPNDLALYDDAATACDRLGRDDEAIAWMERKREIMATLPTSAIGPHRYRYLANLGTFLVHRWAAQPQAARDADLTPLREAEKLVAAAIAENPDAHFGREVYQLNAIRWMLYDGREEIETSADTLFEYGKDGWIETYATSDGLAETHIEGITGLMQLGAAWASLDAFHALTAALLDGEFSALAQLSYLREMELIGAGAVSLHPLEVVRDRVIPNPAFSLTEPEPVNAFYPIARPAAERRNQSRADYENARLAKGRHPDTDPHFWDEWKEPAFPKMPAPTISQRVTQLGKFLDRLPAPVVLLLGLLGICGLVLSPILAMRWWMARKSARAARRTLPGRGTHTTARPALEK